MLHKLSLLTIPRPPDSAACSPFQVSGSSVVSRDFLRPSRWVTASLFSLSVTVPVMAQLWCVLCTGPNVLILSEHSFGAELRRIGRSRPAREDSSAFEVKAEERKDGTA